MEKPQTEREILKILASQPGLETEYNEGYPVALEGIYQLRDDVGILQEEYNIRVIIPTSYPFNFPIMYEVSGKIERILDRHMFKDGSCCVENHRTQS